MKASGFPPDGGRSRGFLYRYGYEAEKGKGKRGKDAVRTPIEPPLILG